jgi:hypothetical protein
MFKTFSSPFHEKYIHLMQFWFRPVLQVGLRGNRVKFPDSTRCCDPFQVSGEYPCHCPNPTDIGTEWEGLSGKESQKTCQNLLIF